MPRPLVALTVALSIVVLFSGCTDAELAKMRARMKAPPPPPAATSKPVPLPPHIAGTIAEYAGLLGGSDMLVQGYGLVVGLGKNGSSEVPEHLREYYTQYLLKHKVFSPLAGTGDVSPRMILDDLDTAVVDVWGKIPPA